MILDPYKAQAVYLAIELGAIVFGFLVLWLFFRQAWSLKREKTPRLWPLPIRILKAALVALLVTPCRSELVTMPYLFAVIHEAHKMGATIYGCKRLASISRDYFIGCVIIFYAGEAIHCYRKCRA